MATHTQRMERTEHAGSAFAVLKALVIGGLVGAGAMLLLAPESGRKTRANIQKKALELRDRTSESVSGTVDKVMTRGHEITAGVREKAEDVQHRGVDVIAEQLDSIAAAAKAGKKALKGSRK